MDIGILGAGAWGTALATVVARNGHTVQFWDPVRDIIDNVNSKHQHPFALPGIKLDDKISNDYNYDYNSVFVILNSSILQVVMRINQQGDVSI